MSAIDGYQKFVMNSPHGESFQTQLDTILSSVTEVTFIYLCNINSYLGLPRASHIFDPKHFLQEFNKTHAFMNQTREIQQFINNH